ncbi:MAG TPA: amylo-alpha-1,6-glucosidase [Roseimicrobium sp.]|nr:amylo-alpha-1,6-glucosidase [Roseimicrobium sp.]
MHSLSMIPPTGERLLRFVGDRVQFGLRAQGGQPVAKGTRALLRTTIGRAAVHRQEVITAFSNHRPLPGATWRDIPMEASADGKGWTLDLTLTEIGFFKAKAYYVDEHGKQVWPDGADVGISVHPDSIRTANTIYCAFPRLFGSSKPALTTADPKVDAQMAPLDEAGYTVIPPSGKLRDLQRELPHIVNTLGCRVLHLLPIQPTPTTYARFGRFGSPYACQDLTMIDPALVEFDKETTGIDQFCELADATHALGARVFLDIVINHTGWGSTLQEKRPEWFLKESNGEFLSPGAWGTVWADLVELEHLHPELWEEIALALMEWCRRGVDGFRCDAGYKVPLPAWQYIIARVRQEYPETIFLLEGLGGSWEATEQLLTEGGMQWAYSELFQNYTPGQIAWYLDYSLKQGDRVGTYVHYSETHDNLRLAEKGRAWSLFRNRLCALTSQNGGFGFTCGVEWLAAEKIRVHGCTGLSWGQGDNIVGELSKLNHLLAEHPCFFDGAKLTRLSENESPVIAIKRVSAGGEDIVLVVLNTDLESEKSVILPPGTLAASTARSQSGQSISDLLGAPMPKIERQSDESLKLTLAPGASHCLSYAKRLKGLAGDAYRERRAQAAWALRAASVFLASESVGPYDWRELAAWVAVDPARFLAAVARVSADDARKSLFLALQNVSSVRNYPAVIEWSAEDERRVTLVPPGHWLLVVEPAPFRATLTVEGEAHPVHAASVHFGNKHCVFFAPRSEGAPATLQLQRFGALITRARGVIRFLDQKSRPVPADQVPTGDLLSKPRVLLTNGRGGMARVAVDFGTVLSKYDCLLGANLHADIPVDRHVFAKRARIWVNADGFISPLDAQNLVSFQAGPPAVWYFVANAGDGRSVELRLTVSMVDGRNTTVLKLERAAHSTAGRHPLPSTCDVRLTVRVDIEDRNFHWETQRHGGAEHHFQSNVRPYGTVPGFIFQPAPERQLRVYSDRGQYHAEPEWCMHLAHPVEASRGQTGSGDAYSPGWFELPLAAGDAATLVVSAETAGDELKEQALTPPITKLPEDQFGNRLAAATQAFVVRRGAGRTVIAGYPWFLDWGRDTLICARGLLAAGMAAEVRELLGTFGRFEEHGTLPNTIHGANASNRDTTDAPLWYGVVAEDCAELADRSTKIYPMKVDAQGRTVLDVLESIAANYRDGTPNGIRMDPESGLIWSPSHFTWMDTNYPAGTPREGYPVEIQALWIRLLRQLSRVGTKKLRAGWLELAELATRSFNKYFWLESEGYAADVLIAKAGQSARDAVPDRALRSNGLIAVTLGLLTGEQARRCVAMSQRHLVIPGALRSLAPLAVTPPLPIHSPDGKLLNDPDRPYWGRYEGDEDTRRKPAYHNGTAWTWTFPIFCEALALAWDQSPAATAAARAYMLSMEPLLDSGSIGQLPEVIDGDLPHQERGCDAQAWGATEAVRVWRWLGRQQQQTEE